jgi:hypothetical protein
MPYESVDALQRALTRDVFHYAKDAKKAAGRALGTLAEIITFYLLKTWHFEKHIAIERRLPEYANPDITHNVEFTLHPSTALNTIRLPKTSLPITSRKITKEIDEHEWTRHVKSAQLRHLMDSCVMPVLYLKMSHNSLLHIYAGSLQSSSRSRFANFCHIRLLCLSASESG